MRLIDADALIEKWYEVNNIGPEDRGARFIGYTEIPRFINNAPTVQPTGDLISRADAVKAIRKCKFESVMPSDWYRGMECAQDIVEELPSAEAKPTVIRSKTLLPTKDFKEWAKRVRETNPNVIVIPCDAEVVSADAEWIPCSERLPKINTPVMLCGKYNEVIGYRRRDSDWMALSGDGWETDIEHPEDFIAWMPLPMPYREDGEK